MVSTRGKNIFFWIHVEPDLPLTYIPAFTEDSNKSKYVDGVFLKDTSWQAEILSFWNYQRCSHSHIVEWSSRYSKVVLYCAYLQYGSYIEYITQTLRYLIQWQSYNGSSMSGDISPATFALNMGESSVVGSKWAALNTWNVILFVLIGWERDSQFMHDEQSNHLVLPYYPL